MQRLIFARQIVQQVCNTLSQLSKRADVFEPKGLRNEFNVQTAAARIPGIVAGIGFDTHKV